MQASKPFYLLVCVTAITACRDSTAPTSAMTVAAARGVPGAPVAEVRISDACDPTTFAVVPGGCQRNGGMKFDQFIAQVTKLGQAPAWHFAPTDLTLTEGDQFHATNYGGETHTFTEVEQFGGGIVPMLNQLSGNTTVAPECLELAQGDFLAPGSSSPNDTPGLGDEHYQCCIHPWMRMTVHTHT